MKRKKRNKKSKKEDESVKIFKDAMPDSSRPKRKLTLGAPPISNAIESSRRKH